jgi:hypothetical protein
MAAEQIIDESIWELHPGDRRKERDDGETGTPE